jgi:hypothetical protein
VAQVLCENEFLRKSNETVIGQISTNISELPQIENTQNGEINGVDDKLKENLLDEKISKKQKAFHKRNRTQYNFNNVQNLKIVSGGNNAENGEGSNISTSNTILNTSKVNI